MKTQLLLTAVSVLLLAVACEKQSNSDELKSISLSLRSLENRLEKIEKRMGTLEKAPQSGKETIKVASDNGNVDEILEAFNEKLYNLEQMMVAAGFDVLSTNEDIEVSAMAELVEEKTMEKRREKYQTSMRELRDTQRKSDSDNYGTAFTELQEKMWSIMIFCMP